VLIKKLKNDFELRPYQKDCLDIMVTTKEGSYLNQMATGLGKTCVFGEYCNRTTYNILILVHRDELIYQPMNYINEDVGIEKAIKRSNGERIVIASVQSLHRRLENFDPNRFDVIITDECHHSAAKSYRKIYDYFNFKIHWGFTATPNRNDDIRLSDIFQKILFSRDLEFGIKNHYLSDIKCYRTYINYDLSKVESDSEDYKINALNQAVNTNENTLAIAKIYNDLAVGKTLIFCCSVDHCKSLQKEIPNSIVIDHKTKYREKHIERFKNGDINCLINCGIFTEGTDLPMIETIIIARPTKNVALYTQMVGRGTRLCIGKPYLTLIDCVGASNYDLCTAPTLLGIKFQDKENKRSKILEGDLFDLPKKVEKYVDKADIWRYQYKEINIWAKLKQINLRGINFFKMPDGSLILNIGTFKIIIESIDNLNCTIYKGKRVKVQKLIDRIYEHLLNNHMDKRYLWDFTSVKKWDKLPATEKQLNYIKKYLPDYDCKGLTKLQANQILTRLFNK
jgi:superfamily II DNA or RNA helicase